jgi:choline dehydrogenase-like flavoprotein
VEVGLGLSPQIQETRRCLNAVARASPVLARDSTQAMREVLWFLKHRRVHQEVSMFHDVAWFKDRFGDIARDPLGIVANLFRHAAGRPKRFRVDSLLLQIRTEQAPNPNSRVTLSGVTDALGQQRAHLHWELTRHDKLTMQIAAEAFDSELRRLGLGELRLAPWLASDELVWPPDMVGGHHHMGTTRMSDDPRTGVVNADCRTHAVDNLFVAGSSVFPTAGYANPTMTLLALAIRLADHLRSR